MTDINFTEYAQLLTDVRRRITSARSRAALAANRELIHLHWDIGQMLDERSSREGWGSRVIARLAADIRRDLPGVRGFSEVNLKRMQSFYRAYSGSIGSRAVTPLDLGGAKLPSALANVPWGHHVAVLFKVKEQDARIWYLNHVVEHDLSRSDLLQAIERNEHARAGKSINNFRQTLPLEAADLATRTFKDPYLFDFVTLDEQHREADLEADLVSHVQNFLLELGQGFAFVGRQVQLKVGNEAFYIDLLFYHLELRAFVVIELKVGKFTPEHTGKLNFYCSVIDDCMRGDGDQQTIGLLLCKSGDQIVAEYALRGIAKPLGLSTYDLSRILPSELESSLPTVEQLESELGDEQQE